MAAFPRLPRRLIFAFGLLASATTSAWAAWPTDPLINTPICSASGSQTKPASVADGAGGAIVTWVDGRSGTHIYTQHVLASGTVDPTWPANGRALCTAANDQQFPVIVSDGAGGAIVAWKDHRNGTDYDIYAQHVLASGAVDPGWPVNGRAVCTAANEQEQAKIATDGSGGAIVTWQDKRSITDFDIYAQHVLASGVADPAWPVDGAELCTAAFNQFVPVIVADESGGAVVAWHDLRGADRDIYAQHVLGSGVVDPAWPADGAAVCTATGNQTWPAIAEDGTGGVIIAWEDYRNGDLDIYAQRMLSKGVVDPGWPADGRALSTALHDQSSAAIVIDGAGGAIVVWQDYRGNNDYDIYAQHVLVSGVVDPAWTVNGIALCAATSDQYSPMIATDGAAGAIVTWFDFRNSISDDIYAQRVLSSGFVDPAWPGDGRALCTAPNDQAIPAIVADASGGAIVAWQDNRDGAATDIYAQRVARDGSLGGKGKAPTAVSLSCSSVGGTCTEHLSPVNGGGDPFATVAKNGFVDFKVGVSCNASPCSGHCTLTPTGQPPGATWPSISGPISGGSRIAIGPFDTPGRYTYTVSCSPGVSGTLEVSTSEVSVPSKALQALVLDPVRPNPGTGDVRISFSLPASGPATIAIYDALGSRLRQWSWRQLPAGGHEIHWDGRTEDGRLVPPGVLFSRLEAAGQTLHRKIIHLQ